MIEGGIFFTSHQKSQQTTANVILLKSRVTRFYKNCDFCAPQRSHLSFIFRKTVTETQRMIDNRLILGEAQIDKTQTGTAAGSVHTTEAQ